MQKTTSINMSTININIHVAIKYHINMCLIVLMLMHVAFISGDDKKGDNTKDIIKTNPDWGVECNTVDVRNICTNLMKLQNCTAIRGSLLIVLIHKNTPKNIELNCDFEIYQFPLLREITDSLIIADVYGIKSFRKMFPNLTVIRGRRLFSNYALGISKMPDLEAVEFPSLIAIQRGHVFMSSSPKLCNLEKINWDRLTLTAGKNNVFPMKVKNCIPSECRGCASDYCWSNMECQKFENDNLANLMHNNQMCHENCLGGCYNSTREGCVVCRKLTDHGACVDSCGENKYLSEHYQRCFTREECINEMGLYIYENECVENCPSGFMANKSNNECVPCNKSQSDCRRICGSGSLVQIIHLASADTMKGCEIINASVLITIGNKINESDLEPIFSNVTEIIGFLKVSNSPYITSLKFLRNLRKIHGKSLEYNQFAFVVYDNPRLESLWKPDKLELARGGIYIQKNGKLCERYLREFAKSVIHDHNADQIQTSEQDVLCDPAKLYLDVDVVSHRQVVLSWLKRQTSAEIEIMYRPLSYKTTQDEGDSESVGNVCTRVYWTRQLLFRSQFTDNGTHYTYALDGLEQFTKYELLLKTFGDGNEQHDARSELRQFTTAVDVPTPPILNITNTTQTTITLQVLPENRTFESVTFYYLEVYELPENFTRIGLRDYCLQPPFEFSPEVHHDADSEPYMDDYEDCCTRKDYTNRERKFVSRLHADHRCSKDYKEYCVYYDIPEDTSATIEKIRLRLSQANNYTLSHLGHFRLYALQVSACNSAGCGSYNMFTVRTQFVPNGDDAQNLKACRIPDTYNYLVHFRGPQRPNGPVMFYRIHFHNTQQPNSSIEALQCLTPKVHEKAKFVYEAKLNNTFDEVVVIISTFAGFTRMSANVTYCTENDAYWSNVQFAMSAHSHHGVNVFLFCFFLGVGGTLGWIIYKRRCWRNLPHWRRQLVTQCDCRTMTDQLMQRGRNVVSLSEPVTPEDRLILVQEFQTVHFHNTPDDDYIE